MTNPNNNQNFNDEALRINRSLKKENDKLKEEIQKLQEELNDKERH
jgi:cell division protein FtsB